MYATQLLLATLKEVPADAELVSHQLMLRAGLIRKLASGLYTWLPLGLRVLHKVSTIVREEMNKIGAQELLMPAIQPAELWEETGRWHLYGPMLLRMQDRVGRNFCFGPTHEEVITDLMRHELRSYKQLPACFYQIQTKFRDEIRPRFGVMRAREFLMKDAYSFHSDKESLQQTYSLMYEAYSQIFSRLGLKFRAVLADSGEIGGNHSHEFHVLADSGEDEIAFNPESDYAANTEMATALFVEGIRKQPSLSLSKQKVENKKSSLQAQELNIEPTQLLKTIIVKGSESPYVALLLTAEDDLNSIKAEKNSLIAKPLTLVNEKELAQLVECESGFIGPFNLNIPMIADSKVILMSDFVCGSNENNHLYTGVNWERDLPLPTNSMDIRKVKAGDLSPDGQGKLSICRGIEVGHIFQLGTKYSQAMQANVLNAQGKSIPMEMGCYGIGISRIVAAAIEQNHDENGIKWPLAMAPFHVHLIALNYAKSDMVKETAQSLYQALTKAGFEVLLDNRDERPGVIFAQGELIGIPHRLVVSDRGLQTQQLEYKNRLSGQVQHFAVNELVDFAQTHFI